MAGIRSYFRRFRRRYWSRKWTAPLQILVAVVLVLLIARFVVKNNHDVVHYPGAISALSFTSDLDDPNIDWSKFAYVQYVTSSIYLCNALMLFSELSEAKSKAQFVLLYPQNASWSVNAVDEFDEALRLTPIARLLQAAYNHYGVILQPVSVLHRDGAAEATWADSYTKLLAFNMTQYERVITLDSDSVVLKNLDELFLLPPAPLALPHVYWGEPAGWEISSQVMVIQPSTAEFSKLEGAIQDAKPDEYDMDIIKRLYNETVVKIPQRPYNLLTGEFRRTDHSAYLGQGKWDTEAILEEAKFVHFSDWPVPKPWIRAPKGVLEKHAPKCVGRAVLGTHNCDSRAAWFNLYIQFALRRKKICGEGFQLQSQELSPDAVFRHGKWYEMNEISN